MNHIRTDFCELVQSEANSRQAVAFSTRWLRDHFSGWGGMSLWPADVGVHSAVGGTVVSRKSTSVKCEIRM